MAFKKFIRRYYVLLMPPVIYIVLAFTNIAEAFSIVPDLFKLSLIDDPRDFFGIIIGSIASIFGILMAVILLTVEFSGDKHNGSPLENELIKNSLYNSINLITLSLLSYILIEKFDDSKTLTIGYLIFFYFLFYLYFLTPVIKIIIKNNSRIKQNLDIANSLTLNAFITVAPSRFQNSNNYDDSLKNLGNELDFYILNNNLISYEKLNSEIINKAIYLIGNGDERQVCDKICTALINIWKQNLKTASRTNDSYYFELIWKAIGKLYNHFAERKARLLHLQDIYLFVQLEFIPFHVKKNIDQPLVYAIDIIEEFFYGNLYNNCPNETNLKRLNELYEKDSGISHSANLEIQWDYIVDLGTLLNSIQEAAIDLNDKDLFENTTRKIQSICSSFYWEESPLGKRQKSYLLWQLLTGSFYRSDMAIEKGLYENTLHAFSIPSHLLIDLIKEKAIDEKDIRVILTSLSNYLINAYENDKLFVEGHYGTVNEFCMIGIHLLKSYKENPLAKKTVDYLIKFLTYLKEDIEEKDIQRNTKIYQNLKSKLKHFIDVAVKFDKFEIDSKPITKWTNLFETFEDIKPLEEFNRIKWK